ncbi:MAG: ring-cleaving dioxygenase [Beijerinckiaceae bacterium]
MSEADLETGTSGIHHITAIAGDPRRNAAFYTDILGLRMIKQTVNFDNPKTYHLYYGDETGSPGTILTFFPMPDAPRSVRGSAEASQTAFVIPQAALAFWLNRLTEKNIPFEGPFTRFGEKTIVFLDPDGMTLELVAQPGIELHPGRDHADIPAEYAIRSFAGITIWSSDPDATGAVLGLMGYHKGETQAGMTRWNTGHTGFAPWIDVKDAGRIARHRSGAGSVHHVAFRAVDDAHQARMAEVIRNTGLNVTEQRDRHYFRSVYFQEPGGVLFEIATDLPGFSVDEPIETMGQSLKLPDWLELRRAELEAALQPLGLNSIVSN